MTRLLRFDFCHMRHIRPGLLQCAIENHETEITEMHLDPLRELEPMLNATNYARKAELPSKSLWDLAHGI